MLSICNIVRIGGIYVAAMLSVVVSLSTQAVEMIRVVYKQLLLNVGGIYVAATLLVASQAVAETR